MPSAGSLRSIITSAGRSLRDRGRRRSPRFARVVHSAGRSLRDRCRHRALRFAQVFTSAGRSLRDRSRRRSPRFARVIPSAGRSLTRSRPAEVFSAQTLASTKHFIRYAVVTTYRSAPLSSRSIPQRLPTQMHVQINGQNFLIFLYIVGLFVLNSSIFFFFHCVPYYDLHCSLKSGDNCLYHYECT